MTSSLLPVILLGTLLMGPACTDRGEKSTARPPLDHQSQSTPDTGTPFALLTDEQRKSLREYLETKGLYDCCVKPGCMECMAENRECDCHVDIRRGDPICGECLDGYKKGQGKLKMVSIPDLERIRAERNKPD